jgi:hypothetical protein
MFCLDFKRSPGWRDPKIGPRRLRPGMRCKARRVRQGGALATSRNAEARPGRLAPGAKATVRPDQPVGRYGLLGPIRK